MRRPLVGAALAATAVAMLGAGYALGTSDPPGPTARSYGGIQATWGDAARESTALKQRAYAAGASEADIRYERVR